jgi:hypothetical protein
MPIPYSRHLHICSKRTAHIPWTLSDLSIAASPPEDLTVKERTPPLPPTKLDFPNHHREYGFNPLTSASSLELFNLLCSIKKPSDITPQFLQTLNLSVAPDVTFQDLLPSTAKGGHNASNPGPIHRDRLSQTLHELRSDHSTAFREVVRLPPLPGQSRIRLSHTRKFWTGLEKMSQYWDCSMDNLYEIPDTEEDESTSSSSEDTDVKMSGTDYQVQDKPADPDTKGSDNGIATSAENPTKAQTKQAYKGRRLSTGSAMPPGHRDETVSALVESVVWAFNCQVRSPSLPPRLSVRSLLFPVRQSFIVGRVPREKDVARKGVLEGPIMGICCRVETSFHTSPSLEGVGEADQSCTTEEWKSILDLSREVAVMLLLAQERARDGKPEGRPGEGKWWTTTPRWGGGPGGLMESEILSGEALSEESAPTPPVALAKNAKGNEEAVDDCSPAPEAERAKSPTVRQKRKANGDIASSGAQAKARSSTSKQAQAERWRALKPGPGIWDKKMKYLRIGAGEGGLDDQIFMVTSLNHHVALLSMSVSSSYLSWLAGEDEQRQQESRAEAGKSEGLQLKRTRWFDLFKESDRVEFVEGLWGVVGWLMRDSGNGS